MQVPKTKKVIRWTNGKLCSLCGQPMLEKQLSKEQFKRDYEMKWAIHFACHMKMIGVSDRNSK